MSGIVATLAMVAAILVNSFGSGSITGLFALVLGFVISTTTLSYLFIFPSFIILRYKYPNVHRIYKVPGGMVGAWIVMLLPLIYAVLASYFILSNGWPFTTVVTSVSQTTYELTQWVPLAIIFLLTIVFYVWGQNESRNQDVVVDLVDGEFSAGAGE
jgi:glutamate:GABA antiporter